MWFTIPHSNLEELLMACVNKHIDIQYNTTGNQEISDLSKQGGNLIFNAFVRPVFYALQTKNN